MELVTPVHLKNVLLKEEFNNLLNNLPNAEEGLFDQGRSRYMIETSFIREYGQSLEERAKQIFNNQNIKSSYSLYCKYFGNASMEMHKDDNACTYTIDLCLKQTEPWGLWVEDKEYILKPNEALCYLGNDQIHGRLPKNLGFKGLVEMMFFHYVTPDHWFFTKNT